MPQPLNASDQRKLIVVSGYYGFDNLGDEAILEELVSELKRLVHADEIVVVSNNPAKTKKLYGVEAIDRWRFNELISVLRKTRLFVSGGGGLFQDATGPYTPAFYGGQMLAAQMCGARIVVYAQGLGPLNSFINKRLTRYAWKLAQDVTVRDENSLEAVKAWGISADLTADPVWALPAEPLPKTFRLAELETKMAKTEPCVGISLRPCDFLTENHLSLLPKLLKQSFPQEALFIMLPFQKEDDSPLLEELTRACQKLEMRTCMINPDEFERPSQWLQLIQRLDMVIGMRLHALLMALKAGKPVVGLPYDPKVSYLCRTFAQPMLENGNTSEQNLELNWLKAIQSAYTNRIELGNQAKETAQLMEKKACKNFEVLARILKP